MSRLGLITVVRISVAGFGSADTRSGSRGQRVGRASRGGDEASRWAPVCPRGSGVVRRPRDWDLYWGPAVCQRRTFHGGRRRRTSLKHYSTARVSACLQRRTTTLTCVEVSDNTPKMHYTRSFLTTKMRFHGEMIIYEQYLHSSIRSSQIEGSHGDAVIIQ